MEEGSEQSRSGPFSFLSLSLMLYGGVACHLKGPPRFHQLGTTLLPYGATCKS